MSLAVDGIGGQEEKRCDPGVERIVGSPGVTQLIEAELSEGMPTDLEGRVRCLAHPPCGETLHK